MQTLRYSLLMSVLALGLFIGVPALASDDDSDHDSRAELWVYVDVDNARGDNYEADDFTIEVDGEDPSPDSFKGDDDGRKVTLDEGDYEVTVRNDRGYRVNYSGGCEGDIDENDRETCRITLTSHDSGYFPYNPVYTAPAITLQKGYVPALPSTGFPPLSALSISLAALLLGSASYFLYPHAKKAFTVALR